MAFLTTNYDDIKGNFEPLPIGDYECVISEVKIEKSKNTGNDMLKLTLTVRDDVNQEGKKRKFFDNIVNVPTMAWKFQQLAKAVGIPSGQSFETLHQFATAVQFKPVRVRNKHEEYNGNVNDRVAYYSKSKISMSTSTEPFDINDEDIPF